MLNTEQLRQKWDAVKQADMADRARRAKEVEDYFKKLRSERTSNYGKN